MAASLENEWVAEELPPGARRIVEQGQPKGCIL